MSSRALRKAQREREEHERLNKLEQEEENSDVGEVHAQPTRQSAFAMLEDVEDDEYNEDDGVLVPKQPEEILHAQSTIQKAPKKKKKNAKKKLAQSKVTSETNDEELDDIDRALKELSTNGNASLPATTTAGVNSAIDELCHLLSIHTEHLHSQNEMRRLFGRAAVEQQDNEQHAPPANNRGNRRQPGQPGRAAGLTATALRRNIFVQGKEEWPQAPSGGLSMEVEEKRADGTILHRFVHNRIYQDVQAQFQIAVESMDPNRLAVLLHHNPYHISTLLQVSEIKRNHERDHAASGDLLSRALFSFGRVVHSTFPKALAEGKARLDFRRAENREFWLAAWRYMQNLSMRALWRTVFEWAKLLLSLAPQDDPYAMWLVLDQYALRARQDLDFLNISRNPTLKEAVKHLPNVLLSQGLAEYRAGNKSKGQQALFTAIGRYPWVVTRLMQELTLDPPPAIWGKQPRTAKETLDTELYATRAKDLWNTPENTTLLLEIASALPPDTPSAEPDDGEIAENVARHVILSDTPALIALIPKRYTAALLSSSDPLPPSDSYPSYLPANLIRNYAPPAGQRPGEGSAIDDLQELQSWFGFFSNMFPWFNRDAGAMPEMTEEDITRRIAESGLDEELIPHTTRMAMELQTRLRRDTAADGAGHHPENSIGIPDAADEQGEAVVENHQPRVEDAEDAGD